MIYDKTDNGSVPDPFSATTKKNPKKAVRPHTRLGCTSLAWPDRFFSHFSLKKAVWPRETKVAPGLVVVSRARPIAKGVID